MAIRILAYALNVQSDVMGARQRARQIAELLGFDSRDQTRIATSVSELARNALRYAGGGRADFEIVGETAPQILSIRVSDDGPGIEQLEEVLDGTYRSTTGMGIGLIGSKRLMDRWEIHSRPGEGTTVEIGKLLPDETPLVTPLTAGALVTRLSALPASTSYNELQAQNGELLEALAELQEKQERLIRMARELEDTNRGVVALYAELDEKAAHLRRADEMKSRFLSNMSHEFRTPLNSMRALCRLLLAQEDGPLVAEQQTQVNYIVKAVEDLSELVNDLLDLAKIEAGKTEVRPSRFDVEGLFSALRGMLRPLLVAETVELVFEEPSGLLPLYTDESKVSQILRNFVANALKFTERGAVRVRARLGEDGESMLFEVSDTGIGIAPEDQDAIFEEFVQVPNPLQRKVKGTGLGLPLCRRLARLLGGDVGVTSVPGEGSTFHARIPLRYGGETGTQVEERSPPAMPPAEPWILVVEDDESSAHVIGRHLKGSGWTPVFVQELAAAQDILRLGRPAAVILDILLPGEEQRTWRWLAETKAANDALPVIVVSQSGDPAKALSLGADAYFAKPVRRSELIAALKRATGGGEHGLALIIDDDDASRYVIRRSLKRAMRFEEARDGHSGLALAARCKPSVIFLDLAMPGMQGDEVLDHLKADPATRGIPVIVVTSLEPDAGLRDRLAGRARAILRKRELSVEALARTLDAIHSEAAP